MTQDKGASDYTAANKTYWERGYTAPNVDACVFRFYGRILKPDFGLSGNGERLVDFGCGQGAAVDFFQKQGFDAYGCDMSENDVGVARKLYPELAAKITVVDPKPAAVPFYGLESGVRVLTAIQSLYYFSDSDFAVAMAKLTAAMVPGAVFYATMMGEQCREFYDNSEPAADGLRVVNFKNQRLDVKNYYMSFIRDEDHLKQKFAMFRPVHTGYYSSKLRNDEGDGFHWTFCGVKP